MDSQKPLMYWEDDHTLVLHLPSGQVLDIGNMTDIFLEAKEINAARAWYNSNLQIDDYMPCIFPFFPIADEEGDEAVERTLSEYYRRVSQRFIGKESPKKPIVTLFHGLVHFDENGDFYEIFFRDGTACFALVNKDGLWSHMDTDTTEITRTPGHTYWDGTHYV